ncbi:MAG TPA: TIM barrel protein [Verrucomicrobiales bacterium]|nr:TIM barrel protein [Verrucomicrobiales bacterium]
MESPAFGNAAQGQAPLIGLCVFSCRWRWGAAIGGSPDGRFEDAAGFLDYARGLGADGVQAPLRAGEIEAARAVRQRVENLGMYYEGDVRLPEPDENLARFDAELALAREAGAGLVRAYLTVRRRYEAFASREEFRAFQAGARRVLRRIEPLLRNRRIPLALENHKDLTAEELRELLEGMQSEWIGVQVDTGNNIALLEDPHAVVEALAPYALSVHLKDMAVAETEDGFALSEVVFGRGFLDLPRMVKTLGKARPGIVFNVEMVTRDPLPVPCLTAGYWSTFPERRTRELVEAMNRVKANPPRHPPPRILGLGRAETLALEEANNRECLDWARAAMGV